MHFSLEREINAEWFPGPDVRAAILVELTPIAGPRPEDGARGDAFGGGRVDAAIIDRG